LQGPDASVDQTGAVVEGSTPGTGDLTRPPPRAAGSHPPGPSASGKDAGPAELDGGPVTTLTLLASRGPGCLALAPDGGVVADACAAASGCLDPAQLGGTCETPPAGAVAPASGKGDYTAMCLKTLGDIFASGCAAGPLVLTPCVCGTTDPATCLVGAAAPSGELPWPDYVSDFGTAVPQTIVSMIVLQTNGSGQANALIQCLAISGCTACLGGVAGDAAAEASR